MIKTENFMKSCSTGLLNCWHKIFLEDWVKNFWVIGYEAFSAYSDKHIQFPFYCNNVYCKIGMILLWISELFLRLSEEDDQVLWLLICV